MVPRELGEAARAGVIDAGLMAVADWFSVDAAFDVVSPPMGIAAERHVRSVMLFSQRSPRRLSGKRIGLTGQSATSRRLLDLLARARWELEDVEWVEEEAIEGDPARSLDAMLLIGDPALRAMASPDRAGWKRVTDLATEWTSWQGLPFVFAVWAVRSSLPRRERERFAGFLVGSLAVGIEHLDEIAEAHAGALGEEGDLRAYLEHFEYRLGARALEGLGRFRDLLADWDIQEYEPTDT